MVDEDQLLLKRVGHQIPEIDDREPELDFSESFLAVFLMWPFLGRGEKDPHLQDFSLTKKMTRFTKGQFRPY